jgi:hypothetical protein
VVVIVAARLRHCLIQHVFVQVGAGIIMFDWIYLSFLECAIRGKWEPIRDEPFDHEKLEKSMNGYRALATDAEIWIVRADGLRRAFSFQSLGKVWIGNGMIKFHNTDLGDEIAIDEAEKSGQKPYGKLDFGKRKK